MSELAKQHMPSARPRTARLTDRKQIVRFPFFRFAFMVFSAAVVVAFIYDMRAKKSRIPAHSDVTSELQDVLLGLHGPRYVDPSGLFSIVQPPGWTVISYPNCRPYNVVFRSPRGADISIMATPVQHNNLMAVEQEIRDLERDTNVHAEKERIDFLGRPTLKRTCQLRYVKVMTLDFVADYVDHHISCAISPAYFDKYEPVLMDLLATYQTGRPVPADESTTVPP